jgi:hypothetical protein
LVRYADDSVVLARYQGSRLTGWVESKLEGWLGLEINREKTRVVRLKEEGASLDFLGFTFRYYDDLQGRGWRYLNVSPSEKALKKEREKLHEKTDHRQNCKPIPQLIEGLNRHLRGWKNYFDCPNLGGVKPSPLGDGFSSQRRRVSWRDGRIPTRRAHRIRNPPSLGMDDEVPEAGVGRGRRGQSAGSERSAGYTM